jgi:hypothetical protein
MDVPRRPLALVGVGLAIAMVAGPIMIARQNSDDSSRLTKFTAIETASHASDKGPRGISLGDRFTIAQDLTVTGRKVGTSKADCTYLKVGTAQRAAGPKVESVTVRCHGHMELPDGTIEFTGRNTFAPGSTTSSRFDLISGTGSYTDPTGELIADEHGNGRSTLWLNRIITDGDRPMASQSG